MQYISDPDLLKELNRGFEPPTPVSSPTQRTPTGEEDQGWLLGEGGWGGVGGAASQRILSGLAHMAAASTTDPEASNYSKRVGQQAARKAESEEQKLGTLGRFAAAGAQYGPAIGAGIVSPVAGAGLAAGMSYGDILAEQEKLTGEYDPYKARLGAAGAGAIDLLSGGLGSKVAPLLKRPAQRFAAEVAEDAASSAGSQVATNLASGKEWDEGYAEAMLGGAAFGQGLRGLNRAGQFTINKFGEKAIQDTSRVQREHNLNLDPTFADNFTEYSNASEALKAKAKESQTPEERSEAISAFTNLSSKNAGEAARMNAYILATDNNVGLTDAAFNYNYTRDLARTSPEKFAGSDFGLTPEKVGKVASLNEEARPSVLRNQKAKAAGETRESHFKQVQTRGSEVLNKVLGNMHTNQSMIDNTVDELVSKQKLNPWEVADETISKYEDLSSTLSNLSTLSNSYLQGKDVSSKIERQSKRAIELATELGEIDNLRGFDGTSGSFNPIVDVMTAYHLENMLKSEYPAYKHGVPQVAKEKAGIPASGAQGALGLGTLILAPAAAPLVAARAVARRGIEAVSAGKSQKRLRKSKETTAKRGKEISEFARQIQAKQPTMKESLVDEAIIRGEPAVAAKASETALADEGIIVPEPSIKKVTPDENERLWREAGLASRPAQRVEPTIEPEVSPEAFVEAPSIAPEVMAKPRKESTRERRKRLREERKIAKEVSKEPVSDVEVSSDVVSRRPVDLEAARQPTKPVEKPVTIPDEEITTVTKREPDQRVTRKPVKPVTESVTEDLVQPILDTPEPSADVTSRVKAEDVAKAPRKPPVEEDIKPEPTQEAPKEVEAAVTTEAPKREFVDMVTKPTRARIEELESLPSKSLNNKLSTELGALRAKEKATARVLEDVAREEKVDMEVVARHIHEAGGIDKLGEKYKAELKSAIKAEKSEIAKTAREKAKALKTRLAGESRARREAEAMEGKSAAELAREVRKAELEADAARKAEEKAKLTTGFATMAQARKTLSDLAGKDSDEGIKKLIENFTRDVTGQDKGPTVEQMRNTINKIVDRLEASKKSEIELARAEKKRYEEWLEKGQADTTVDEAAYKARKDQLHQRLKKNLEQAKRDKGPRSLVQKEIDRIQKEHNKEVKRLDDWLRKGSQDRIVQEAEFKDKAAQIRKKLKDFDELIENNKKYSEKVAKTDKVIAEAMEKTRVAKDAVKAAETTKKASEVKPNEVVKEEVKRAEEAAEKEFSKATEDELKEVAKHYSSEYLDSDMSPEDLAQTAGIMKGLSKESSDDKVKAVTSELSRLFEEAATRKASMPDNPETWITSDMFNRVKAERFGDADQSWVGSLAQNLTKAIMGKGVQPNRLKTESEVKKIVAESERIAAMTPEEKSALKAKGKARGALAAKARTKGVQQAPKKGRLFEFVG